MHASPPTRWNRRPHLQLARPRWHVTARIHTLCLWFTAAQFCRLSTVADSASRNDVQTCRKGFLAHWTSPALLRTFKPCDHPSQHCSYSASEVLVEQRPIVPLTPRRSQGHQQPGGTTHPGARDVQQRLAGSVNTSGVVPLRFFSKKTGGTTPAGYHQQNGGTPVFSKKRGYHPGGYHNLLVVPLFSRKNGGTTPGASTELLQTRVSVGRRESLVPLDGWYPRIAAPPGMLVPLNCWPPRIAGPPWITGPRPAGFPASPYSQRILGDSDPTSPIRGNNKPRFQSLMHKGSDVTRDRPLYL